MRASHLRSSPLASLFGVLLLSFAVRLIWVCVVRHSGLVGDGIWYHERAIDLLAGRGYSVNGVPTAMYPPGYPFFLALFYSLFGVSTLVVKIAQVVVGTLSVLLTYLIGARLVGHRVGLLSAAIMAVYPNHVFFTSYILSEIVFTFFFLIVIYLAYDFPSSQAKAILVGTLIGVASLIRPTGILLLLVIILWWACRQKIPLKYISVRVGLLSLGLSAVMAPWTVRNYLVFGSFVPLSTSLPFVMAYQYGGLEPTCTPVTIPHIAQGVVMNEVEAQKRCLNNVLKIVGHNPSLALAKPVGGLFRLLYHDLSGLLYYSFPKGLKEIWNGGSKVPFIGGILLYRLALVVGTALYVFVLVSGCLGLIRMMGRGGRAAASYLLLICCLWLAAHAIIFGTARFKFPLIPLLAIPSAAFLIQLSDRRKQSGDGAKTSQSRTELL